MENSANTQATNTETQENNKLIAEFMGVKPNKGGEYELYGIIEGIEDGEREQHFFFGSEMKFHNDWNWLMQVVEKIENLQYQNDNDCFKVVIDYGTCIIYNIINAFEVVIDTTKGTKKEAVYTAVISFIKWYNANK